MMNKVAKGETMIIRHSPEKWHVVPLCGPHDRFDVPTPPDEPQLVVPLRVPGHETEINMNVDSVLANYGLAPSPAALDLLDAAVAAYAADVRVPRRNTYDGWTRQIDLHLSVRCPEKWEVAAPILQRMLRFLTGDYWEVSFRSAPKQNDEPTKATDKASSKKPSQLRFATPTSSAACLFSGGLDSFVGAIDELSAQGELVLVGHHAAGGGPTSRSQKLALELLREKFDEHKAPFLQFWVSPPKGGNAASEITTRGRSIIFLGLGVLVAESLGLAHPERGPGRFLVPENGFISLNVPLTNSRLGSFSTRTTHPHLIALLRELISALELPVQVEMPFRFATKGEMLRDCADPDLLRHALSATMSCAHPGVGRWRGAGPGHCGRCLPCLVQRAAISFWVGNSDPTSYAAEDLTQPLTVKAGSDLRALKMALERYQQRPPRLTDMLISGPLPASDDELRAYFEMFTRSVAELRQFADSRCPPN